MRRRHVQRVEQVVRRLDLAALDDLVAHAEEDVLDLAPHLRDQVQAAAPLRLARQRDVELLLPERPVELGALEGRLPLGDCLLDPLARRVQGHPGLAAANRAKRLLQLALSSQVTDARLVQLLGGVRAGDGVERLADELVSVQRWPRVASRRAGSSGVSAGPRTRAGAG